jgi:DNA-binding NarL/FixJ family response regulator
MGRRIRTLIVDDSPVVERFIRVVLGDNLDVEVVRTARDGLEALILVGVLEPDLVLMDLEMPVMNGLHATKKIRRTFPQVRVLIVSSVDRSELREAWRACGADGFVSKQRLSLDLNSEIIKIFACSMDK